MKGSIIGALLLIGLVVLGGAALAQGQGGFDNMFGEYKDDVKDIVDSGSYEDLEMLREEIGHPIMMRVHSNEDLDEIRQRHSDREAFRESVNDLESYQDLVELRSSSEKNLAPYVDSEDDFAIWKAHHDLVEEYREKNGIEGPMKHSWSQGFKRGWKAHSHRG